MTTNNDMYAEKYREEFINEIFDCPSCSVHSAKFNNLPLYTEQNNDTVCLFDSWNV